MARLSRFVPAADEVERLQKSKEPEGDFFRRIAAAGHYRNRRSLTSTRQGIYAFGPDGIFLGSLNSNEPGPVVRMLDRALLAWEKRPAPAAAREDLAERPPDPYPTDGLVLRVTARDLPRTAGGPAGAWNRDFAWFRPSEVREMVPLSDEPGARRAWPEGIARRLAQCHLVDFVRGQTGPFRAAEVHSEIRLVVTRSEGRTVTLEIEGRISSKAANREMELDLTGSAAFDRDAGLFRSFEMIAHGRRRGGTLYNQRQGDPGPAPLAFHLVLAAPAERMRPGLFWAYEW